MRYFQVLFKIEEEVTGATAEERQQLRQRKSRRVAAALHRWLNQQRGQVPDGSATAKAIDDSLKRWQVRLSAHRGRRFSLMVDGISV